MLSKMEKESSQLMRLIDMEKTFREESTLNMITMIEKTRLRMRTDLDKVVRQGGGKERERGGRRRKRKVSLYAAML